MKYKQIPESILKDLESLFLSCKFIFHKFSTEHKRFSLYVNKKLMIMLVEYNIGIKFVEKTVGDEKVQEKKMYVLITFH